MGRGYYICKPLKNKIQVPNKRTRHKTRKNNKKRKKMDGVCSMLGFQIWGIDATDYVVLVSVSPLLDLDSGMLFDRLDPTEPLGILVDTPSLLVAEVTSGLNSDEDDDGARVAIEVPTGYGATSMSVNEDADEL